MSDTELKNFVNDQVSTYCDADPEILTNYILALVSDLKSSDAEKSSLKEKLLEFFEDETDGFIDRLGDFMSISFTEGEKAASKEKEEGEEEKTAADTLPISNDHDEEDEEDEEDRSFKHRRHRQTEGSHRDREAYDPTRSSYKRRMSDQEDTDRMRKSNRSFTGDIPSGPASYGSNRRGYQGRSNQSNRGRRSYMSKAVCKDFNEKGFCVRGDLCPYDHGEDTIVYEDRTTFNSNANPNMPLMGPSSPFFNMPNMFGNDMFNPENLAVMQNALASMPMNLAPGMIPSPEDIMKQFMQLQNQQRGPGPAQQQQQQQFGGHGGGPMRRGRGGGARGGYDRFNNRQPYQQQQQHQNHHQQQQQQVTSLVVDNIPAEKCQVTTINDYFKKFGSIINISLQPQKAIVQFSTREEAEAAYSSPDAIFDNRFVKVYWHKETDDSTGGPKLNVGAAGWKNQRHPPSRTGEPDPSAVAAKAAELQKLREEKAKKRQEQMKAMLELQKQKEQLLQQQIDQQKQILAKLSDKSLTSTQKEELLASLKKIAADIDASKAAGRQSAPVPAPPAPPAPVAAAAPALTLTPPVSGTSEFLKEKLAKLEAEAASLGISGEYSHKPATPYYGRGGGWSGMQSRGGMVRRSIDNRPTRVMIKDVPQEIGRDDLHKHFQQFGRLLSFEPVQDAYVAHYSQRYEAEKAMAIGSQFPAGQLSLSWYTNPPTTSPSA